MDLSLVTKATKDINQMISRNSPTIFTGLGVAGLVATIAFAVKGTIKAQDVLYHEHKYRAEEWENETGEDPSTYPEEFTTEEMVDLTWRFYIPTVAMAGVTIACMIASNSINLRRNAALAGLYSVAESALKEYQAKVVEEIGKGKEEKIKQKIAQDHLDRTEVTEKTVIITGNGDYLCFDDFSSRYFRSNIDEVRRAEIRFNQRLLRSGWLPINEFYDELRLDPIEMGDEFGWIAERELLEVRYDTKMAKATQEPCLVIRYSVSPHHI